MTGHKGDTIKLWDYFKDYVKKDENGKYYVDVFDDKYIYTGNDDLMTATRTLEKDGIMEFFVFNLPKSSNDGISSTGNTDTGSTSNPTDETKPSTSTDSGSTGSTDTSSSSQTEPSKPVEKKITNTFNLIYENNDGDYEVYYTFTVSGNKGDVVNIWDYIKDKVKKNDEGQYYFTVDGKFYVNDGGQDLMTETSKLEYDGASEDFEFSYHEKKKEITNTVNLTYSGKDKGVYYSFDISGYDGDKVPVWDYIKDKVQQDEDGKYYITVNGDKYPYANLNDDLKTRFEIVNGATTKEIHFEYPKEDKE